ncbi:DUF2382 domain-containing protein [Rufibacter sp. DG15C]|uniref:DUF2382 domain-containing protein n=1 Tax=Rufibacter sp. DG15C TaxID=1379909 RepID=UPI000AD5387C|nr:PRC and DUF2382 domain-containing protein [Rufibacter sp. DG15C]
MERDYFNPKSNLQELGGSDYEIVDDQPNIKGWTVKNQQGQTIGEVEELIFDVNARKVRYMVVDLEGSMLDLEPRDVLVPIGMAQLHESDDDVILPSVTVEQFRALPTYEKGHFGREIEDSVKNVFEGLGAAAAGAAAAVSGAAHKAADAVTGDNDRDDDYYKNDMYSDQAFKQRRPTGTEGKKSIPIIEENLEVGKREVETGGVHVSSRIVEQPVEEHVRLREERVVVERTPVDRPATDADINSFKEGEISMTERAEVPVVNKEARVVEEVSLEKDVEEREETIRDTVRSTEVDVDRLDDTSDRTRLDSDRDRDGGLDNDNRTRI